MEPSHISSHTRLGPHPCAPSQDAVARGPGGGPLTLDDFSPLRCAFEDRDLSFMAAPLVEAFTKVGVWGFFWGCRVSGCWGLASP